MIHSRKEQLIINLNVRISYKIKKKKTSNFNFQLCLKYVIVNFTRLKSTLPKSYKE